MTCKPTLAKMFPIVEQEEVARNKLLSALLSIKCTLKLIFEFWVLIKH